MRYGKYKELLQEVDLISVKGHWKVLYHLILNIIALTVKQLFSIFN